MWAWLRSDVIAQDGIAFYPAPAYPIPNNTAYWHTNPPNNTVEGEVCANDNTRKILFQLADFSNVPTTLYYLKTDGSYGTINLANVQRDYNRVGGRDYDFFWVSVPADAESGMWSVTLNSERANIRVTIIRPEVVISLPTAICSADTIALSARPRAGLRGTGRFWSGTSLASLINNSPHIQAPSGSFANNSNTTHIFVPTLNNAGQYTYYTGNSTDQPLYLAYEYTPILSNPNITCPAIQSSVERSRVYNNQLDLITFSPVSNAVDSIPLNSKIERLLPAGGVISNQLLSYRGNHISTNGMFYPRAAGNGRHTIIVTLSNNNKCFAFDTTFIEVTNSFNVTGLDSSMCRLDTNVSLTPSLPYSKDSSFNYLNGNNYKYVNEYNLFNLSALTTTGTPLPAVITAVNTTPGHEVFKFNPSLVSGDSLWVSIQYSVRQHTYITTNGVDSLVATAITPTVRDTKTIYLRGKPMVSFARINNYYCESHSLINLAVYPTGGTGRLEFMNSVMYPSRIITNIYSSDSLRYFIDSLHNPTGETGDVQYRYHYRVGSGACQVDTSKQFSILEPIAANFTARIASIPATRYCKLKGGSLILEGSPLPTAASTFMGTGVVQSGSSFVFRMDSSSTRKNPVTYKYVSPQGCESYKTDTIILDALPFVSLETATHDTICNNTTTRTLIGRPRAGTYTGTGTYVSINTDSALINPQALYPLGRQQYIYTFTDTANCTNADTLSITVAPSASLSIINQSTGLPVANLYCQQSPEFTIILQDTTSPVGGNLNESNFITGRGFIAGTLQYRPSQVPANSYDTLVYTHTNSYGCVTKLTHRIRIESVPQPRITGLNNYYCIDAQPIRMTGFPTGGGTGTFTNVGGGVSQDTFYPSRAGTGRKVIEYRFQSNNGCTAVGYDTVDILALPPAVFTGLERAYCSNVLPDTLREIQNSFGSGVFSGYGITGNILNIKYVDSVYRPGTHFVYYTFTDTFGCSKRDSQQYYINRLPIVAIDGVADAYCTNSGITQFRGTPRVSGLSSFSQVNGLSGGATGIATFDPNRADTGVAIVVSYTFRDTTTGCSNIAFDTTRVFVPPVVDLQGLPPRVCQQADTILLTGVPAGGIFLGSGTDSITRSFYPMKVINLGTNYVRYKANISPYTGLYCESFDEDTVIVLQRPSARVLSPAANSKFCSDGLPVLFSGENAAGSILDSIYTGTGVRDSNILVQTGNNTFRTDSLFMFDPSRAGLGMHTILFSVRDSAGCTDVDTVHYTVVQAPRPAIQDVDSTYCESETAYILGLPQGGTFYRNRIDTSSIILYGRYQPNPQFNSQQYLTRPKWDTIIYQIINDGLCYGQDTVVTHVYPIPQPTFVFKNPAGDTVTQACLGRDVIDLEASPRGGTFVGPGVLYQSTELNPALSKTGEFSIKYTYTDSTTGCSNSIENPFRVYSMPTVNLSAVGGCGNATVVIRPDTSINLSGTMSTALYDSVTTVQWTFGDGSARAGRVIRTMLSNTIDSVHHFYGQSGIYFATLTVTNRGYCTDTDTLRIVLSPQETPLPLAPYNETFETSNGSWFDESESGNSASNLWTWGVARGRHINTANNVHNKVWATLDTTYMPGGSWVYSPCFDLTQLTRPMISFDYFVDSDTLYDGAVIEYYDNNTGTWKPLGNTQRGLNWFNTPVIAGAPGAQTLAPMGWSGRSNQWKNGRYKLDEFKNYRNFRFRVAFGADSTQVQSLDGFAFDNVWIGDRKRNVLVEHFSNTLDPSMYAANQHVYDVCYHPDFVRDVVLIQNHTPQPANDLYYLAASEEGNVRTGLYGFKTPGNTIVNGAKDLQNRILSIQLTGEAMERDMLAEPAFTIELPTPQIANNQMQIQATIRANRNLPDSIEYFAYVAVTEDTLMMGSSYIHSVMRALLPTAGHQLPVSWNEGDSVTINTTWDFSSGLYNPNNCQVIVFVQRNNNDTVIPPTVYQVATTRDVSRYVGVVSPEVVAQAHEAETAVLFPNPAEDYFNVSFEKPLSRDFNWKLVDMHGREITGGIVQQGTQQLRVDEYDVSSGMYFFVMYTKDFVTRRKVILARP